MLVYPQTLEFTRNCHRQIGFFLLVEAPAPIPSEHRSLLGNACCGYAILQIAGLHNTIAACFALLFRTARLYSKGDDFSFRLDDLKGMNVTAAIAERGHDYYTENKVRYLCIDGAKGLAIVEGSESYMVEFEYRNGEISHLICECPCSYTCKHEFAAMLQLRETLELIDKHYSDEYERTGYFAAISKGTLFAFAIDGKEAGSFEL